MKTLFAPSLNRQVKFGRKRRAAGGARVHFSDFVQHAALPPIPAVCDYSPKAAPVLADIYGNDALGDCVIAGGYHILGVETGNATGTPFHATHAQIVADYSAIGGYVPGDASTDNGCLLADAIRYWTQHGFANGTKLLGAISLNAASPADIRAACFLFENLKFGIELPDAWVSPFPSGDGFVWDVAGAADPNNGHDVIGFGYDLHGVAIDSWGMRGTLTWNAIAAYAGSQAGGELYALLTADQLTKGAAKAPNGVAWADLVRAFDAMGGNVPVPVPPPPPVPVPPAPAPVRPSMTLTLQGAQLFAIDKLNAQPCEAVTKTAAMKLVCDSLDMHWAK
jgi:hypothetical protein